MTYSVLTFDKVFLEPVSDAAIEKEKKAFLRSLIMLISLYIVTQIILYLDNKESIAYKVVNIIHSLSFLGIGFLVYKYIKKKKKIRHGLLEWAESSEITKHYSLYFDEKSVVLLDGLVDFKDQTVLEWEKVKYVLFYPNDSIHIFPNKRNVNNFLLPAAAFDDRSHYESIIKFIKDNVSINRIKYL